MIKRAIPVIIREDEALGFVAITPALPGCIANGDTLEETFADFKQAVKILLETYKKEKMEVPWRMVKSLPFNEERTKVWSFEVEHD